MRQTSIGFESMQKYSSPPSILSAIRFLMISQSSPVTFRRSLNWRLDIILGNDVSYSVNRLKRLFSLSILKVSAVKLREITSKSENLGTTPLRFIFPASFAKSLEKCLHISRNLANIVWKLCICWLCIKSLVTSNILIINNMRNFLYKNLFYF